MAAENGVAIKVYEDLGGGKSGDAAVVTKLHDREERTRGKIWEDMDCALAVWLGCMMPLFGTRMETRGLVLRLLMYVRLVVTQ